MTPHNPPGPDPSVPDSPVVRPRPDGLGVTIDKSVVEAILDETDHGLVPDGRSQRAPEDLLDALVDAFTQVSPWMDPDVVADCRGAARTIRALRDDATPVYVTRRDR
ncbi:hypothetical protein [Halomarina rubra]|uniref:Halobacterial output domain-containing protein n=1 Tax=Halomarina rubra TaxID=2071873 RepID=A0ABD6AQK3_9EURY|nr:hypothetical protein [Halomarina rubra]